VESLLDPIVGTAQGTLCEGKVWYGMVWYSRV